MTFTHDFSPTELPYSPAILKHLPQAGWRIDYYAYNPATGERERVRMCLNDMKKRFRCKQNGLRYQCQIILRMDTLHGDPKRAQL